MTAKAAANDNSKPYVQRHPWWTTFAMGRIYRPVMKLTHWLGFCFPQGAAVEPGYVWCHWCGMRGRKPLPVDMERVKREMAAADRDGTRATGEGETHG